MPKYFTKNEARTAVDAVLAKAHVRKSSAQLICEARSDANDTDSFDVFLSHSTADADLVLGVKKILEQRELKVYVGWDTDSKQLPLFLP